MTDIIPAGSSIPPDQIEADCLSAPPQNHVETGQWYWVKSTRYVKGSTEREPYHWLGCLFKIGSNYVEIRAPSSGRGHSYIRVHADEFFDVLTFEPNAEAVIKQKILMHQTEVKRLLGEVNRITALLGVSQQKSLAAKQAEQGTALVTLSAQSNIKDYETALVKAKDKDLPDLFNAIKAENANVAMWMSAEQLPLQAMCDGLEDSIEEIKDRIFNVSLYAGLMESVEQCCDGEPAAFADRLHVMQRRLYMDEECLLNYSTGGMEFKNISQFDAWISKPENRNRILPFPRCMVAMRVRRVSKDREWDGTRLSAFINIMLEQEDKLTFLYIRNGEQLFRINTELDFSEQIFPDQADFDPNEPMMVKMFAGRVSKMMSVREFEFLKAKHDAQKALYEQWFKDNPKESFPDADKWRYEYNNPYRGYASDTIQPDEWTPFDKTNVYFDECMRELANNIKHHNRIALIIQGLFDRSHVLHPHPPVKTWTREGFDAAIKLIYDGSAIITNGPTPDFDVYKARCNAQIDADSVMWGQMNYWMVKEAAKYNAALDRSRWSKHTDYRPRHYVPTGNPGPGLLAKMDRWAPRSKKATFSWYRERQTNDFWNGKSYGDLTRTSLTVPVEYLFNVSAYKAGDYKQFFADIRTRALYLKWAPMLLAAEDYLAGKMKPQMPVGAPQ